LYFYGRLFFIDKEKQMKMALIAAMSQNRVIGNKGRLPWSHLPLDWANFFEVTKGCRMIMGRKSYDTPDRLGSDIGNFVITRQPDFVMDEGFERVGSLKEALERCQSDNEVFVIGGEQIFRQVLPLAQTIHLTVVHDDFVGDAYFPELPINEFRLIDQKDFETDERHAHRFSFLVFERFN
jgi:dihydrofolate reductase